MHRAQARSDAKSLKRHFLSNEEKPAPYRAQATSLVGKYSAFQKKDIHEAAEIVRLGLGIIKALPPEHDGKALYFPPHAEGNGNDTLKHQLQRMKMMLEATLCDLEGQPDKFLLSQLRAGGEKRCFDAFFYQAHTRERGRNRDGKAISSWRQSL